MSARAARHSLFIAAVLIVWGPPALRISGRELDAALADPFAFDAAALLQVSASLFADALVLLLLISHLARRTRFLSDLLSDRPLRWYGLYGLLGLFSFAYSSSPLYTGFFAQKLLVGIIVLALLDWHWPAQHGSRALQVLFLVYALQAAAIAILYFVDREWVTPFASGGTDEPVRLTGGVFSDYGSSALLSGLFFLTVVLFGSKPRQRLLAAAAYLGTWTLIVMSQTRSTMAAGVLFLVVMLLAHPRARAYGALIAIGTCLVIVGLLPAVLQDVVSVGTREGQGLDTLSGRTVAFSYLIERWQDSPLFGYGYAAGSRDLLIDFVARRGLNIGAGHDALSTVLADLGLVGAAVLLAAFVTAWVACVRLLRSTASNLQATTATHQVACLLVWVTIQAVVSRSLAAPSMVFVVAIVTMWTLRKQRGRMMPPVSSGRRPAGRLGQ
jgi:hypothetical protein